MLSCNSLRRPAAGVISLAALLASAAGAQAAVSITDASITGGKLVVSGTASSGAAVQLDGQFDAKAGADGSFSFSVVYHPGDCIVTVGSLIPPYMTAGESADALVANCGRDGVNARGAWSSSSGYVVNDLVTHDGSTWRARRNNAGRTPSAGADWEVFAAAGADGTAGVSSAGSLRVPPTGPAGGDLSGTYPNPQIRNQIIVASNMANGAITNPKINDGAVNSNKILDNSVRSVDIFNNTILGQDIADSTITTLDIADGAVTSSEILDGTIAQADLGFDSVGSSQIQTDAVQATEIADNSIDSGEVVDFGLSNEDVGVLYAQINADGTLFNSSNSGTTSSLSLGTGTYEIDFGRNITNCAFVGTQGEGGIGGAGGAIVGLTDRAGNVEGIFATTRDAAGALVNTSLQVVVVC